MKKSTLLHIVITGLFISGMVTLVSAQRSFENIAPSAYNYALNCSSPELKNPCAVFIGVSTTSVENGGLNVIKTIDNTPAKTSGILEGDLILAIDGVKVNTQSELIAQRDKHQPGDAFTLTILRNGQEMKVDARFKTCSASELEQYELLKLENEKIRAINMARLAEMEARIAEYPREIVQAAPRPILGIYPGDDLNNGVQVGSVISGKGAEKAGLQEGDIITTVDGKTVRGEGGIAAALAGRQIGEVVTIQYLRNGQTTTTSVTLSAGNGYARRIEERDPCKVFIGVYTGNTENGKGVRISGVIDNTPAKESNLQAGDIILELDGQALSNHTDLRAERDKHQPGDRFTLTILRDGEILTVNARFKNCGSKLPEPEILEQVAPETGTRNDENSVKMNLFNLSPNPTFGILNIQFEAEAVPTVITISDISGKMIYNRSLNQFNGFFNEQIDLDGQTPGNYILNIVQGEKVTTKKFILMPRA